MRQSNILGVHWGAELGSVLWLKKRRVLYQYRLYVYSVDVVYSSRGILNTKGLDAGSRPFFAPEPLRKKFVGFGHRFLHLAGVLWRRHLSIPLSSLKYVFLVVFF